MNEMKKEESLEELLRRKEELKERIKYLEEYKKEIDGAIKEYNSVINLILRYLNDLKQLEQNKKILQENYDEIRDNLERLERFNAFIHRCEFSLIEYHIKRGLIGYIKNSYYIKKDLEKYKFDYIELEKKLEEIKKKFKELYNEINEAYNDLEKHYIENVSEKLSTINSKLKKLLEDLYYTLELRVYLNFLDPLIKDIEAEYTKCRVALSKTEFLIFHRSIEEKKLEKEEGLQSFKRSIEEKKLEKEEGLQSFKNIKKKEEKLPIISIIKFIKEKLPIVSIITFISYITLLYLLFVSGNILVILIVFIILVIIIGLVSKKPLSWIAQGAILGSIIMITIYILFYTTFVRSICVFMPSLCPQRISLAVDEQILGIRKTIEETVSRIRSIMENPELAYIENRAESVAATSAYRYMFEIEDINKIPVDYTFYLDSDSILKLSIKYLYYAIRSSLPLDSNIKMYFNAYCLIRPRFKLDCLTTDSLSELGKKVIYDGAEFFFDEKNNFYENIQVPEYGIKNIKCLIPTISINISNCEEISYGRLYFQNNFLILISNITTKTIYKFLVVDESVLINSLYENKNIYQYLKLDEREYDVGYFDGFLDFPKINILRLSVLSEYPIIRFRNLTNVSDVIYVSFKNINELYDVSDFEIEMIYNPNHIKISLDPQFEGIKTTFYDLTCEEYIGKVNCKVTFKKIPDDFNRNRYIIFYRNEKFDKFFFFIPIIISFTENFVEYSEVIINAKATYGIEKNVITNLEYIVIKVENI